jgi:uncharacterized membrane protein YobD (UPF0266 family)
MASVQEQSNKNVSRTWLAAVIIRVAGVTVLFLLTILCVLFAPPPLQYAGWIVMVIVIAFDRCAKPYTFFFRKRRAGTALLSLGRLNKISNLQVIGALLVGVLWLVLLFTLGEYSPAVTIVWLGLGLYSLATALADFIVRRESTVLTENGIYAPKSIVLWNRIESRQWLNQHEDARLVLKLKNRPWPFDEAVLSIPVSFKTDVDKILLEKI